MGKVRYVIIGNSVAAVNCIEAIRGVDKVGDVTVVSDEEIHNYSRPLLSYYLGGRITEDKLPFRDKSFYEKQRVTLLLGAQAERLDSAKKEVGLEDGTVLPYDRLLISVGGLPIIPSIKGFQDHIQGIFTFLKLRDAKVLIDYIEQNKLKDAVVLGAGLIGLKVIEGLQQRGLTTTVIELMDKILSNTFDKEASSLIEDKLSEHKCRVIKEDTIYRIETKRGRIERVILRSGLEIPTSLLIIAAGVRPNLTLVEGTPIATDRGIVVNRSMRTNIDDIYAAGDCAQGFDFLSRTNAVIAIWPVAARQGKVAGLNMSGEKVQYTGLFAMNSIEIIDVPTISFGITTPPEKDGYEVLKRLDRDRSYYKKIVVKDNRVVGVILVNSVERAGVYGMLIREGINVRDFKDQLLSDDFGLLVLPKEFRKHLVAGEGIVI